MISKSLTIIVDADAIIAQVLPNDANNQKALSISQNLLRVQALYIL